jgi:uridine phosphorylase
MLALPRTTPTKVDEPPIFSPEDYHSYLASRNKVPENRLSVPARLIFTFHRRVFDSVKRRIHGRYVGWYYERRLAIGALGKVPLAVLHSYVGSSAAAMMLEEMIASGARRIVEVGVCGGLAPSVRIGDIIVAEEALVDEGTSSHYYFDARRFSASNRLTGELELVLKDEGIGYKVGGVWTTDAPYRETRTKLLRFRREGAVGVNMESSALFAVGEYRHVDVASLQVVSDLVGEMNWRPSFHSKRVVKQSLIASEMAVRALAKY